MKVLVIGTGNMGAGFVKQLTAAGHQVSVTARDFAKAQALALQHGATAVALDGAANNVAAVVWPRLTSRPPRPCAAWATWLARP